MTELGVYILGATALVILAAAGIALGNHTAILCAVASSGAAYISQLVGALAAEGRLPQKLSAANLIWMAVALGAWLLGTLSL